MRIILAEIKDIPTLQKWQRKNMIRELRKADIIKVAGIWLDTNIKAHNFIPTQYWESNYE